MNIIMKPSNAPKPKANPTQEKIGQKWYLGHFFPQQIFFRGLGLVLCRKQTTRKLRTPTKFSANTLLYFGTDWYTSIALGTGRV